MECGFCRICFMKIWINTILNASGLIIPSVISLPAMGYIARSLGVEGFGVFLLLFGILGYASIFDFGLNRALVLYFAKNQNDVKKDSTLFFTGLVFVLMVSVFVGLLAFCFSDQIFLILNLSDEIKGDAILAIKSLSVAIPLTLLSLVMFSVFEGKQLFFELNVVKIISGSMIGVLPAVFVFLKDSIFFAILGVVFARLVVNIILACKCFKFFDVENLKWSFSTLKQLLKFGGWITLSNIMSLIMSGADKFFISNLFGAKVASFYISAMEMIVRISIIPGALAKTIFPYFADPSNKRKPVGFMYLGLMTILALLVIPLFVFSREIFSIWLGEDFSIQSSKIFIILLFGFIFNSLAQIPFAKIQASGLAKLTTLIHAFELIPYIILFFILMHYYGVIGAAYAWSFRAILDFFLLEFFRWKRNI